MTDRYVKIRKALAMEPTPGPWVQDGDGVSAADEDVAVAMCCPSDAEAAFIAACDPDTIRALLEERDALQELRRNDEVAPHDGGCLYRLKSDYSLEYWRGALEGAFEECEQIERTLGLPPGVHTRIYTRLKQWESLLNRLEEVRHDV